MAASRSFAAVFAIALGAVALCSAAPPAEAQTARPRASPKKMEERPAAAPSQRVDDRRWQELADEAEGLLAKGDLPRAEQVGREVVDEAKRVFGDAHANTAASLSILGGVLLRQGRFNDAEERFRQAPLRLLRRCSARRARGRRLRTSAW